MARLRKPSPNEATTFAPPSASRATRSSPRKATRSATKYISSSDDEEPTRLVLKSTSTANSLKPRKQRTLRPVESNSRLLPQLNDEDLTRSEKKQRRERRERSGSTGSDFSKKNSLVYAKILAKSVVERKASTTRIGTVGELDSRSERREKENVQLEVREIEVEEDVQTSLWCGDEEETPQEKEATPVEESSEEDDDDPVVVVRQRGQRPKPRRIVSDSEDEGEREIPEPEPQLPGKINSTLQPTRLEPAVEELGALKSMRLPHRKAHSTISNWTQEEIDLTSSPEQAEKSVPPPLPPPTRMRSDSASSRPPTSSSQDGYGILTYSPTPTKHRSPCKAPPITRPATPPLAPPSPGKLKSPSKKKPTIPPATHLRPSLDAFWDPEVVNDWNDKHSPTKPLVSPRKQKWRDDMVKMMEGINLEDSDSNNSDTDCPSPTTSPHKKNHPTTKPPRSPTKKPTTNSTPTDEPDVKTLRAQRKTFSTQKHTLAESFLASLDSTITSNQISTLAAPTGGIKLIWSRTLKTTAGRANWRREALRLRTGPLPSDFSTQIRHHCSIELAEKIIDDEHRLYNVLAHEFCHLATFMISNVRNNPHGKEFKAWGNKASRMFAEQGVEVTTKHSYAIEYKYEWECVGCGYVFKRHSRSIDTERHSCGKCRGRLAQVKPVPRGGGRGKEGGGNGGKDGGKGGGGEYQKFVKENFGRVKGEMQERGEDTSMGRVVERVAREYREMKGKKEGREKEVGLEEVRRELKN